MSFIYISAYVRTAVQKSTVNLCFDSWRHLNIGPIRSINQEWKIKDENLKTTPQVIWKDAGGGNDFSGASVLPDYQVSRFLSHCFSFHHPKFLRIKRSKKGDTTLTVILKCSTKAERLSDGLRTMALRNLSSGALSNERVGYYSTV